MSSFLKKYPKDFWQFYTLWRPENIAQLFLMMQSYRINNAIGIRLKTDVYVYFVTLQQQATKFF